ncbi:MAG: hypothetical protein M1832_001661 [Thelocarpon impressellum]|nr:MAG: hypothetical protein M1832_001661 [Thelocarpon impressellum]
MDLFKPHKEDKKDEGQDLATLLSPEQRGELTLLVASATSSMRKTIEDTFDASHVGAGLEAAKQESPNVDAAKLSPEEQESQRKAQETRERELSAPRLQELKEAALDFFDKWQDSVVLRVGEVLNSREAGAHPREDVTPSDAHPHETKRRDGKGDEDGDGDDGIQPALLELYPQISTPLASLGYDQRVLILHSMLLLLLSLEHYIAHSRVLLLRLTLALHLPLHLLSTDETKVARGLLEAAKQLSGDDETQKRSDENKIARRWKVGLASVAGAAVIGVTGGLAAPLVAAGIGGVMGGLGLGATAAAGYLGTLAGSGVLVGGLFGAYRGRMTGKMMDAYAREVQDFAFLPVRSSKRSWSTPHDSTPADRRLRVVIGVTGWLTDKSEVVTPWRVIGNKAAEPFALRWELSALLSLGNALTAMVTSAAWGYAKSEIIKRTIFASLTAALWPIGLLKISRVVDNPFSVAKARAEKAGEVLADALFNKAQGERPVSLIGYSLGARAIHACLLSLARRRAFGLVESVVLIGAPLPSDAADWRVMRTVVSGRLVNVFSANDYILAFLYRTSSIQLGVAGLQPIAHVRGVQNVDVSAAVSGHLKYRYVVGSILKKIDFEDVDLEEVEREEAALRVVEKEEEKSEQSETGARDADDEARRLEEEVKLKNKQSDVRE